MYNQYKLGTMPLHAVCYKLVPAWWDFSQFESGILRENGSVEKTACWEHGWMGIWLAGKTTVATWRWEDGSMGRCPSTNILYTSCSNA